MRDVECAFEDNEGELKLNHQNKLNLSFHLREFVVYYQKIMKWR